MKKRLSIFGPGIRAMRCLRVSVKMSLMGILLMVPMALLLVVMVNSARTDVAVALSEIEGVRVAKRISAVVAHVQDHRGLTARAQQNDAAAVSALAKTRTALAEALKLLDASVAQTSLFQVDDLWAARAPVLRELAAGRHASNRSQAFTEHTAAVEGLRQMLLMVAERSGLLLDPQASTFFLMDISMERTLPVAELLASTRDETGAILTRGEISNTERVRLLGRLDSMKVQLTDLQGKVDALKRSGMPPPPTWEASRQAIATFATNASKVLGADVLESDAAPLFNQGSVALGALNTFSADVMVALETALGERAADLRQHMVRNLAVAIFGISAVLYMAISFYLSFRGALRSLLAGVEAVAGGNLEHKVDIRGRDEIAEVGTMLERMNARLSAMVAEIRSSAVRVGQAGQQVAASTESLAERTDEQAASLRQTVSTVDQMNTAVASNAEAAQALDQVAGQLRVQAEAGGEAMRATVGSMATLESGSKRVAEIIGVIDGISFQTNILALNAAVEAARAGEAGRGFAVVASEVRMLAQRSSAAAAEIRQLIGQSSEQVSASVGRIGHVSAALDAVVAGVQDVSGRLRGIAAATAEQSVGLREMSSNVGSLDKITRQNASMVEESSQASQELVERAGMLSDAVASIRLRQGSADEAHALVERALELIRSVGLSAASQQMRDPTQGFVDRDMYVFITDREGVYRLHSAKPANEGKRIGDVPGIDGAKFNHDVWHNTEDGPGWVEYDILNLETGIVQPKASFMARLDENLVLGCGIYRSVPAAGAERAAPVRQPAQPRPATRRLAAA